MGKKNVQVNGSPDFMKFYTSLPPNHELKKHIDDAMDLLKLDLFRGNKIEKKLWPKRYIDEHGINNLFRYQLPKGYRMLYTIVSTDETICLLIEVLTHKEYDKLFGY